MTPDTNDKSKQETFTMRYEPIANDLGYEIRHDMHGFYACTIEEAEHEDEGNASVGFDGRAHFTTIEDAAQAVIAAERGNANA